MTIDYIECQMHECGSAICSRYKPASTKVLATSLRRTNANIMRLSWLCGGSHVLEEAVTCVRRDVGLWRAPVWWSKALRITAIRPKLRADVHCYFKFRSYISSMKVVFCNSAVWPRQLLAEHSNPGPVMHFRLLQL